VIIMTRKHVLLACTALVGATLLVAAFGSPSLAGAAPLVVASALATPALAERTNALVPSGYKRVSARSVQVDRQTATLVRYERGDGRNAGLGGEHASFVFAPDGRLKGFTRMDGALSGAALPSRDQARAAALDFMHAHAPDLVTSHEVHWVERHDERIRVGGVETVVAGMKVKMRNRADGLWMWVIVGPGAEVVTFERDIVWITMPGRRGTEKWLHDAWLKERLAG
jgi:hypothetical protein